MNMSYDTANINCNLNLSLWYISEQEIVDALHSFNTIYSSVGPDDVLLLY